MRSCIPEACVHRHLPARLRHHACPGDDRVTLPAAPPGCDPPRSAFVFDAREIVRFQATRKYVAFTHRGREYLMEESLQALEQRLASWSFLRVHRGELVSLNRVVALHLEGSTATIELAGGVRVPVSRRRLPELRRAIGLAGSDGS